MPTTYQRARTPIEAASPANDARDRRRSRRLAIPAVATVSAAGKLIGICAVDDLSSGGIALMGEALPMPGQLVDLHIQMPGRPPLELQAKVLRRQVGSPRGRKCALRFLPQPASVQVALEAALNEPAPVIPDASVLLVWNRSVGGPALVRDLSALGISPLLASAPLEAAAWLRAAGRQVSAVLVDYLLAGSNGWDFLQYLREQHPQLRRVLLVDGVGNFRLNLLLSSGLADAVLEKPWTQAVLERKLNARGPDGARSRGR